MEWNKLEEIISQLLSDYSAFIWFYDYLLSFISWLKILKGVGARVQGEEEWQPIDVLWCGRKKRKSIDRMANITRAHPLVDNSRRVENDESITVTEVWEIEKLPSDSFAPEHLWKFIMPWTLNHLLWCWEYKNRW